MLRRVDRLQLAVPERRSVAERWTNLLGAEPDGEDRVACLGARRTRLRLGDGCVELLEPDGAGPVAEAVARRGAHLYAAGVTTHDLAALAAHLRAEGAELVEEGGQLFLRTGSPGLPVPVVVSPDEERSRVGDVDFLYETTVLVDDAAASTARCAALFGLDTDAFVPIESKPFGYAGTLTLFDPDRLDRFEVVTPNDATKTMGRFFDRFGESCYMAFAETSALAAIEARARESGAGHTSEPSASGRTGGPNVVFLHPPALGGMMLGLSRPTHAWTWSGRPDRVVPAQR